MESGRGKAGAGDAIGLEVGGQLRGGRRRRRSTISVVCMVTLGLITFLRSHPSLDAPAAAAAAATATAEGGRQTHYTRARTGSARPGLGSVHPAPRNDRGAKELCSGENYRSGTKLGHRRRALRTHDVLVRECGVKATKKVAVVAAGRSVGRSVTRWAAPSSPPLSSTRQAWISQPASPAHAGRVCTGALC